MVGSVIGTSLQASVPNRAQPYLLVCKLMDHDYVGSFRHWVYIAGGLFAERLNNRSIRAQVIIDRPGVDVKACGARLIYSGGVTEFVWNLNLRDEIPSHIRNLSSPNDESDEQEQETTSDHQLELKHVPVQYQAQMNCMISLYDTRGRNKQSLDHDAGSSSRTGSSTQVPHQRLERPELNDQSNEQEQGTNSQLTHTAESGCASDTGLLIEIEPHTSRDNSTSTKIDGDQLGTNVESFLEELFELGGKARSHDIGFIFSLRAILPWFNHQSIGNLWIPGENRIGSRICLPLARELYNNKEWVGFALYVSFTVPPGVGFEEFCCGFRSSLETSDENLHYLRLWYLFEDNYKGSERLFVIHIPRGRFEEQVSRCDALFADFVSDDESVSGAEVEMFGMRVVCEQDLKGLIQTITQCTIKSPFAVCNDTHGFVANGKTSILDALLTHKLTEAAESSKRRRSTLQEPLRDSKFISDQQINLRIHAGTPYIRLKNKDAVVEWKRNLKRLLECFFSFSDLSIILTLNRLGICWSSKFCGIFPQEEIPEWFTSQHPSECMASELPPNLENDVNFMGLAVCAAFSVHASEADVLKYLDSGHHAQLKFHFQFSSSDGSYGSIRDLMIHISPNNEFMWLCRRGFIWQHYLPRDTLKHLLRKDTSVKVSCGTDSKVLEVQKCSFRILYKQGVEKLKQTIIQCFTAFFDNEDINRAFLVDEHPGYNYGTTCSSDEQESCGTTPVCQLLVGAHVAEEERASRTSPPVDLDSLKNRLMDQGQLLDFDRFSIYNCCFPPSEIVEWFGHNSNGPSVEIPLPPNSTDWIGLALCACFEVIDRPPSNLDSLNPGNPHHLTCYFETETDRDSLKLLHVYCISNKEFQWLHLGGFVWLSYIPRTWFLDYHQLNKCINLRATIASDGQGLGVLKCGLRLLSQHDEKDFRETIMHCQSQTSGKSNHQLEVSAHVVEEERASGSTAPEHGKSNNDLVIHGNVVEECGPAPELFFIEIEPPASTDSSSTKITGELRRSIESSLEQLFQGDKARHCHYGFILSPRVGAVMPWFSHHAIGNLTYVMDPPRDLYEDRKWVGFALYVAFTTQSPDSDFAFTCSLSVFPSGNTVVSTIRWGPDQFSGSQRRLCFIHIPRARLFSEQSFFFRAEFDFSHSVASEVEMCGARLVYDEDVKGLVQTITQSTITSPPVYFSQDDKTEITPEGEPCLLMEIATSLVAHSKACIQPTRSTLSPPGELVPSPKFGRVLLAIDGDNPFKKKDTSEWKRNVELLLQSFFRFDLVLVLRLGGDHFAGYQGWFNHGGHFPKKEIPDWFTEKSLTSTFLSRLPDDLESDNNWMGFIVCAAFSVHPHPTDVGNYKDSQLTSNISCNFRWSSDSSQFFLLRDLLGLGPNNKLMWLCRRGFIWLQFISRHHFKLDAMNKSQRQLEASFESGSLALAVQKCSLRIFYKQDVQEYKQTLIQCFASVFDNLDHSQPYNEDDDSQHNKEPIHEDDQIDSVGTTSLSEDTQPETKARVLVPQSETSGNSFNRFNSILFEPILYDKKSAVIFADFRGWEE